MTSRGVTLRLRDWVRAGVPLSMAVLSLLASAVGSYAGADALFTILGVTLASAGMIWGTVALTGERWQRGSAVTPEIRDGTLFVGNLRIPRATVRSAVIIPREDGSARVFLHARPSRYNLMQPVVLDFASLAAAETLLAELGVSASQQRASFMAMSPLAGQKWFPPAAIASLVLTQAVGLTLAVLLSAFWPIGAVLMWLFALLAAVSPGRVEVGLDGIRHWWLGRARFYAFRDITRVTPFAPHGKRGDVGVDLTLQSGQTVRIISGQRPFDDGSEQRLAARVREAMAASSSEATALPIVTEGRSASEWLREARGIGSGASASHRAAAAATDALVRIVADPQHSEAERVAAAVAWLERGDDDAHERVRITARATASEPLRRALEAAAERDEAALLEAAAALDGSAATKRR